MSNILIIDFGSQVTQLIARRVRECGVYCEIMPFNVDFAKISAFRPSAIILSGGPASVHHDISPKLNPQILSLGVPILGICYGQQAIVAALGGVVESSSKREFGRAFINITKDSPFYSSFWQNGSQQQVWMSHGDKVTAIPSGFEVLASNDSCPYAIIADNSRKIYAVQFHPEVMHTPDGAKLIRSFVQNIAGIMPNWSMKSFHHDILQKIRNQVGDGKVICALSGGVDSSVVAKLLHEAIGSQLQCIFVDTGLLRKNEGARVQELFEKNYGIPLIYVNAGALFLDRLAGVSDPELKRKIIGELFITIFELEASKIGDVDFLAQGTLYPDVIESVSFTGGPSVTIKSHHNVGGLPERMNLKLVEPLRELFKDEVRLLGRELGMNEELIRRHPFPGPGLAIRIPGEVTPDKVKILQEADEIYLEEIRNAGLYDEIWQAFAVLLPVKTVGVMGDARTYENVCALRAVTSSDGMTADYYHFSHEFLSKVSNRIINEVKGINRMVYDITSKPPGTIEWE